MISDIGVIRSEDDSLELGYKNLSKLSEGLKKLVFKALLRKNHVQLYEKQGERIIKGLFEVYTDSNFNKGFLLLPPEFRGVINKVQDKEQKNKTQKRIVIDYIAGMMDSFTVQEYKKYFGSSSLDLIYDRKIWKSES